MATNDCDLMIEVNDQGLLTKLANAWVYWREAGVLTTLRANADGTVLAFGGSGDNTKPSQYTRPFRTHLEATVDVFFSTGAQPVPNTHVMPALLSRKVTLGLSPALRTTRVAPGGALNSIRQLPLGKVEVPQVVLSLTHPVELSLWFVLQEVLDEPTGALDPFYTESFPQGTAWAAPANTPRENAQAPAVPSHLRQRERGIRIDGTIAAGAQVVRIAVLDRNGNPINLRPDPTSSATVPFVRVAPQAANGAQRSFSTPLFFADAGSAFGLVQILVSSEGLTPPIVGAFSGHVVGLQLALVEDSGTTAGVVPTEAQDVAIVDYTASPKPTKAAVEQSTRIRRMVPFAIHAGRQRNFTVPGSAPPRQLLLTMPEMPMWMAEAQLVGIAQADLEDLMIRRLTQLPNAPATMALALDWELSLQWDGPDFLAQGGFSSSTTWTSEQTITLTLDNNASPMAKRLSGVDAQGAVPNALNAQPVLTFPAARRKPTVIVASANRSWGRHAGAGSRPSIVCEWQPAKSATVEEIHGGNGLLTLKAFRVDSQPVDGGLILPRPTTAAAPAPNAGVPNPNAPPPPANPQLTAAPSTMPRARLPAFRVRGENPNRAQLATVVDAFISDYLAAHADPWLSFLNLAQWQNIAGLVVGTESVFRHFANVGPQHFTVGVRQHPDNQLFYGKQRDMPTFGPPRGYGLGQRDPPSSAAVVFSYLENARECVRLLLRDKAGAAFGKLVTNAPAAAALPNNAAQLSSRQRNIFARETIRRYNGGTEFIVNAAGNDWVIHPSVSQARANYPNEVLGRGPPLSAGRVDYEDLFPRRPAGGGPPAPPVATQLPFTAAHFIPGL